MENLENIEYRTLIGDKFFSSIWQDYEKTIIDPDTKVLKEMPEISKVRYIPFFKDEYKIWQNNNKEVATENFTVPISPINSEYGFKEEFLQVLETNDLITVSNDLENQLADVAQLYNDIQLKTLEYSKYFYDSFAVYTNYYEKKDKQPSEGESIMGVMLLTGVLHRFFECHSVNEINSFFKNDILNVVKNIIEKDNFKKWSQKYSQRYLDELYNIQKKKLQIVNNYIHLKAKYYQLRKQVSEAINADQPTIQMNEDKTLKIESYVKNSRIPSEYRDKAKKFMLYLNNKPGYYRKTIKTLLDESNVKGITEATAHNYFKKFHKL